ncbi:MAG: isoleucine--tRNA ligase [Legionellales bacterium]|jgi:isoleucyl-tRNA synthetase
MTNYKDTLNLPQTDFPMKGNLPEREPAQLAQWDAMNLYQRMRDHNQGNEKFVLHDGPPYANGDIHIGHAVNKILKDMIMKSKTLQGFDTPYVPGWDCHGLPIEHNVEKNIGKVGEKVSASEFRAACRAYADTQYKKQRDEFIRLGVLGDWQHPYLTMDFGFEAEIVRVLARIIENGHLHQGFKPVNWCMDCRSALAEAEVEYQEKTSPSIEVLFPFVNESELAARIPNVKFENAAIVIWTTTPWTLPANQAVALHPDLDYALVKFIHNDKPLTVVLLDELVPQIMSRWEITDYHVLAVVKGRIFEHLNLKHPWFDRNTPVVLGEYVTTDAGTGCVHTAPAHGEDDYRIGLAYNLPLDHNVDGRGCFTEDVPVVGGLFIFKANPIIIETLERQHRIMSAVSIKHSYPHCWRHKTPVIFRATPQWFISMEQADLRKNALKEIDAKKFLPEWGQARIYGMVDKRPDWCISRQRTWCTPIAGFVHKDTGKLHPDTIKLMYRAADLIEQKGIEAWYDLNVEEFLGDDNYIKITDGLDVWFDSGSSHAAVLAKRPDLHWPADIYLEGSDQHRGWFQSSLLTGVAMRGEAPFKEIVTHGFVVDAHGHKMSKSLGNVVAPQKVIKQLGADVLRLWVASTDYRGEMTISDEVLKRATDAYRRMRNTARFLLGNLHEFKNELEIDQCVALDRYMIKYTQDLQNRIIQHYEAYAFHLAFQEILNFCSNELGGFYLDVLKDRLYTAKKSSKAYLSAQTALYYILQALTRWIAPVLSFTAEEIWHYIPGEKTDSVFLNRWFTDFPSYTQEKFDDKFWQQMLSIRDDVNKELENARAQGIISGALDANVILSAKNDLYKTLNKIAPELRFLFLTSNVELHLLDAQENDLSIRIEASNAPKCIRCWQKRVEIGHHHEHKEICDRCIENVDGEGEQRLYV